MPVCRFAWLVLAPFVATSCVGSGDAPWDLAFDVGTDTALSGVSGNGPADVYMVGGDDATGSIWHFDGDSWMQDASAPATDLLVWVHVFDDENVWIVGEGGAILRGRVGNWEALDGGTTEPLWGVWGTSPNDLWIVGGDVQNDPPVLLHWDGNTFTDHDLAPEQNDRDANALFKVWGIGGRTFAVGQRGLIIEWTGNAWEQHPAGAEANDDFVALWGTGPDNILAVGGRAAARLSVFDGTSWTTSAPDLVPGLNAVSFDDDGLALLGGVNGWVGTVDPRSGDAPVGENVVDATSDVHAIWYDGADTAYGVAGNFTVPYFGAALARDTR